MKRVFWVLALVVMVAGANALADPGPGTPATAVSCRFKGAIKGADTCIVRALICQDDKVPGCKSQLQVICDDQLEYNGGIDVDVDQNVTHLEGIPTEQMMDPPMVSYATPEHLPATVVAWLRLVDTASKNGVTVLRGFCNVQSIPRD